MATLRLGIVEGMATNDMVRQRLTNVGFLDVNVEGNGRERVATGTWGGATRDVDLPSQVKNVSPV